MRRAVIVGALLVVGLLLVGGIALASAFVGNAPMVAGAVGDRSAVVTVVDGYVSCLLVRLGERRIALVDACLDPHAGAIQEALATQGATLDDVELVLLSHGHSDHVGGVASLGDVEVLALPEALPALEGRAAFRGPLPSLLGRVDTGIRVKRPLADGEILSLGEQTIEVVAMPGHTAGSAAYLVDGVLYLGDSARCGADGTLRNAPWIFSDDTAASAAALAAVVERFRTRTGDVAWAATAHTGPCEGLGD